ncbi:MAG: polymer-forming cytoskeletal protein [Anaerolineae bacterium]|nr:polymer-forming cytoskeletal protein [Anaerolineae bacterium]
MRIRRLFIILIVAIVLMIVLANFARQAAVSASLVDTENIIIQGDYDLNQSVTDDLVVVAERIMLQPDSLISGDAALVGGDILLNGAVGGDLTALAESLHLGPTTSINGNALLLVSDVTLDGQIDGEVNLRGETVTIGPEARLGTEVYVCAEEIIDQRADAVPLRPCQESALMDAMDSLHTLQNLGGRGAPLAILLSFFSSLGLSGLAILSVAIFPRHVSHIEEAIRANATSVGTVGFMLILLLAGLGFTLLLVIAALPLLAIILLPVYLFVALVFLGMTLAGWVTVSLIIGDLLVARLGRTPLPPLVMAAFGSLAMVLGLHVLLLNPITRWVALVILLILCSIGLGAALITRIGTRPVYRSYLVQG